MDLTHNIIEYVNCCVGAFANRFKLSLAEIRTPICVDLKE